MDEKALQDLFHRLKQTDLEDYEREAYEGLAWLKGLSGDLQAAVETKERQITDLESDVDDLRVVETALEKVAHRVKLRLGLDLVEGQLSSGKVTAFPEDNPYRYQKRPQTSQRQAFSPLSPYFIASTCKTAPL